MWISVSYMVGAGKPGKCRETLSKKEREKEINEINPG